MANLPAESGGLNRTDREILLGVRQDVRYVKDDLDEMKSDQKEHRRDVDLRLRALENFRWWILGAVLGSSLLSSAITRILR